MHGHDDNEPCGMNCPVGGADGAVRIYLNDGCNHRYGNVCPACAELTDEEAAAIREYARLLRERSAAGLPNGTPT
ncbi:hypothetical protein NIIDNTM18_42430 [Mycolicibacterium litorale]|uniref:Uncharacterized protein n=1 Tax=Mycolicibacterium litorale TaxID=758802 RepID=A0A6S6P8X0_9MYCO|nr:hypothetical protein NIIDNTM18_42430 [Mycolicibacterium litorale]